jgi:hypothetical protein
MFLESDKASTQKESRAIVDTQLCEVANDSRAE